MWNWTISRLYKLACCSIWNKSRMSLKRQAISISVCLFRNCILHKSQPYRKEMGLSVRMTSALGSANTQPGGCWRRPCCAQVAGRNRCGCARRTLHRWAKSHHCLSAGMVRQRRGSVLKWWDGNWNASTFLLCACVVCVDGGRNVLKNFSSVQIKTSSLLKSFFFLWIQMLPWFSSAWVGTPPSISPRY